MARVLIVDDESNLRRILSVMLRDDGHEVQEAGGVADAKRMLADTSVDVVVTDHKMPDGNGLDVLKASADADATLPVVFLTAHATIQLAVDAMRQGAFDVVTKPFHPDTVRAVIRRAGERAQLMRENARLRDEVRRLGPSDDLIGTSEQMRQLRSSIARVAPTTRTVLITGETGTGKELVARCVHATSARAGRPFVAVNCAALAETLLESELFGHERGAFTGADRARQGLFESADGGTLFLDEAGEMSLALQAKLLRVITDGQVVRLGATAARSVDVRIIVATHRDLLERIAEGTFREDLYYRIAVLPLHVAPLRERRDDIPLLVDHFSALIARDLKLAVRRVTPDAIDVLRGYPFPGNVRELRNLMERAYILSSTAEIGPGDFPIATGGPAPRAAGPAAGDAGTDLDRLLAGLPSRLDLRATLEAIERGCLERALEEARGVQAEAGRSLGLSRSDIAYKVRRFGLQDSLTR